MCAVSPNVFSLLMLISKMCIIERYLVHDVDKSGLETVHCIDVLKYYY